ncbi:GNAT family N-acetyltransferase [Bacillus testis]|uniref:GNAT family N-acetyltransferase n=1 Tax=Bacillus testis TaxID=1622072 RepID=UPI00067F4E51|nr:GNAT family protein [Bacillus testis]
MDRIKTEKGPSTIILRKPTLEDAEEMISFYNRVGGETDFLSFGRNEYIIALNEFKFHLSAVLRSVHSTIVLAEVDGMIIGIGTIDSSSKKRMKHVGTLGIVVDSVHCNKGVGTSIMKHLISWAEGNQITRRIELKVREDNERAIHVYEKFGFQKEGLLREDNCINGIYYNTVIMGLLLY